MESATLLLLASGMGVMFGWQPMPDGSPRYEYIVQIEPELLATFEEGQSIPISSEVPEDIQPIGRIRVMVGRNPLPRQKLTTTLKPLAGTEGKKSLDGVIQTQFTAQPTGAGRYPTQPQTNQPILPPSGTQNTPRRGFAKTFQNAAQPINDLAAKAKQILPPSDRGNFVNSVQNSTQNLGNTIQNSAQNLGNQLRSASEAILPNPEQLFGSTGPVRETIQQTGQQLRGALQNASQQTQNAFNQLTNPLHNNPPGGTNQNTPRAAASDQAILPPGGSRQQPAIAGPITPPRRRLDQPVDADHAPGDWQSHQHAAATGNTTSNVSPPATNNANNFNSKWPQSPQTNTAQGNSPPPLLPPSGQQPSGFNYNDRYTNNPTSTGQSTPQGNNTSWPNGPSFPPSPTNAAVNNTPSQRTVPAIEKGMLDQPANANLETARRQPLPSTTGQPTQANQVNSKLATNNGWDFPSANQQSRPEKNTSTPAATPGSFSLVLSWVLLCSSGFGNVYLLWNYFDVRQKYRGLVHNTRGNSQPYSSFE